MKKFLYRSLIELSNRPVLSKMLSGFTASKASKVIIPSFIKTYRIDEAEMEKERHDYLTLQELFVRRLKPNLRPIVKDVKAVVSPVDAVLEEQGKISSDASFYVKGLTYSLADMLGSETNADRYVNGYYLILYLSPSHYHRIHSPVDGEIINQFTLGEKSYPVNRLGLLYGKHPLSKNYRSITAVKLSNESEVAIVKVGAMNINSIHLLKTTGQLQKGEELAYFSFGSTVVLLFEEGAFKPLEHKGMREIKMGEKIGSLLS